MLFDQVSIQQADGSWKIMTPDEFYKIALEERVPLLCKGWVRFFKDGAPVSALKAMRPSQ